MKLSFYFLLLTGIMLSTMAQATVIRVNNREPSVPEENTYDNLQDAYNKAQANDTLYIEGSPEEYGSLTLEKPLTMIGPGYLLNENENTQAIEQAASVNDIAFNAGSEGSKMVGVAINQYQSNIFVNANNIEISSCYLSSYIRILTEIENLNVNRCYFENTALYHYQVDALTDIYFANNIVVGSFSLPNGTSGNIINNVFAGDEFNIGAISSLQIHNNVLLSTDEDEIVIPSLGSNISHNIASLKTFGTEYGNQTDILASQVFLQQGSTDSQWQIKADGVAASAGREGVDIGAFGGPDSYRLSGVPSVPRITDVSTDGYVTEEGELRIQIQVTAN